MRLFCRWKSAQEHIENRRGVFGCLKVAVEIAELQADSGHHLFVSTKVVEELLPVRNLTMFEHELPREILKEEVFSRSEDSRKAFLLFVGHWSQNKSSATSIANKSTVAKSPLHSEPLDLCFQPVSRSLQFAGAIQV